MPNGILAAEVCVIHFAKPTSRAEVVMRRIAKVTLAAEVPSVLAPMITSSA
jgi:hypothetical protein